MKNAFGLLELLIVLIIAIVIYFTCFHSTAGRKNPFDDGTRIKSQQQIAGDKIKEIENTKEIKQRIEKNLIEGNR